MRSDNNQLDVFRDDPRRIAAAWRASADHALQDVQFSERERKERHDYYAAKADELERAAGVR